MKAVQNFFFVLCLFFNPLCATEHNFSPNNTLIWTDLDGVLIQGSAWTTFNILYYGCIAHPCQFWSYVMALIQMKKAYTLYMHNNSTLYDDSGNTINGFTFYLLYHSMQNKPLIPYLNVLLESIESSRRFIEGTKKIYQYLSTHKGYTIIYATNNDHLAYTITAQALGEDFTDLATYTYVAQPGNSDAVLDQFKKFASLPNCPTEYRELLQRALTVQPTATIIHAPGKKPESEYYQYLEKKLDASNKNIIFIDDRQENIDGFDALAPDHQTQWIGLHFKNPVQLADEFVALGILSETEDRELLEKIRYPGIITTIKSALRAAYAYLTTTLARFG